MNRYYTANAKDKRSIPKPNDKQNRVAFDHGNQVPVHSAQQNLIKRSACSKLLFYKHETSKKNEQTCTPLIGKQLNP